MIQACYPRLCIFHFYPRFLSIMKTYKRQKETPAILAGRIKQRRKEEQQARADSALTMTEVAKTLGIHRDTLKRWIKEGKIPDARRNSRNSYRMFTQEDVDKIRILMQQRKGMAINDEMDGRS